MRATTTTMRAALKIATFNIHKGIGGVDRRYDLSRTLRVLADIDADVLLLQEVDTGVARSGYDCQPELIARELGYEHSAASMHHPLRAGGAYGNVTLSRLPILENYPLDLSLPMKKRRGALYTRVELPCGSPLHVFNMHLGLAHFERAAQVRKILHSPHLRHFRDHAAIVAGDSNDWRGALCRGHFGPGGFREIGNALGQGRTRTFPALAPMLALDRIYFRGLSPREIPDMNSTHRHASDHRPLAAIFDAAPEPGATAVPN